MQQRSVILSQKDFKDFFAFLNLIRTECKDFSIENGTFRSRSNDRVWIIETELSFLKTVTFSLPNLKDLLKMISQIEKKNDIEIVIDEEKVIFKDHYQGLSIPHANQKFLDNEFVTRQELESIFHINTENLFHSEYFPPEIVKKIKSIAKTLYAPSVRITHQEHNLNNGLLLIVGRSNDRSNYQLTLKEAFNTPMKPNHYFHIAINPFEVCKSGISINYYLSDDDIILHACHIIKINDLTIKFYGRSPLIEET